MSTGMNMIGTTIDHYKIEEKLGEGGMGVVYKATDIKLDRTVALKFLTDRVNKDTVAKERFLQEAKAAAALNHQNIGTIYGVEEHEGQLFIEMEFVDGGTLRDAIDAAPLTSPRAIDIGIQIGEALQEAHAKGIVHREVKADNVMLNAKGQAKVMDFGLAKLKGALKLTRTSSTVGTLGYMAPEQIQGGDVDSRSDIFSFGVLLFEMLTGKLPFRGEHEAAMVYSIVNEEPESLERYMPNASAELQYVLKKTLEKDPEDRYQQIADVVRDLRRLKKQTTRIHSSFHDIAGPSSVGATPRLSPSETPALPSTRNRIIMYVGGIAALFVIALAAYLLIPREKPIPFQHASFTRITNSGKVNDAVFSPDGRYIVYSEYVDGKGTLTVRQMATSSAIRILGPMDEQIFNLTFSPDGNFVYYVQSLPQSASRELYRIPVLGGPPTKITVRNFSTITFSPDGKHFTFVQFNQKTGVSSVRMSALDGSDERVIASVEGDNWISGDPAWAPVGNFIAIGLGSTDGGIHNHLAAVDVASGAIRTLSDRRFAGFGGMEWNAAGTRLMFRAPEVGQSQDQIYCFSYPSGEVTRITNDANSYSSVSWTADGKRIAAGQNERIFKMSFVPEGDGSRARALSSGRADGIFGMSVGPDKTIYYVTQGTGTFDIVRVSPDGSDQRIVASDSAAKGGISVTPDGQALLYTEFIPGSTADVVSIPVDGGAKKRFTTGNEDNNPRMDPSGRWVVMASWLLGPLKVMKVPSSGGDRINLSGTLGGENPFFSDDGRSVYFSEEDSTGKMFDVYSVPLEGGTPVRLFTLPKEARTNLRLRPGHRQIGFLRTVNGVDNIWTISLDGSGARQYTNFTENFIAGFEWMPNGRDLIVSRGTVRTDVVMIQEVDEK